MIKTRFITLMLAIIIFASCAKEDICFDAQNGILRNFSGLDVCGWTIELNDGKKLEPTNLSEFDLNMENGLDIRVSYQELPLGSYCMVGVVVEIDCISKK